jgi:hypothetical protein
MSSKTYPHFDDIAGQVDIMIIRPQTTATITS